ncbi:MAG: IS1634 family transposase [Puia sp.]|nr:IS1634 family transposase [Puia sp.]
MSADTDKPNLSQPQGAGPSIESAEGLDIDAERVDHLLIVKAFADALDLVETVNRLVHTQMEVKPGLIVLGLVLDTLTGRSPLYRLVEFFEGRDTGLLLGESVPAGVFTDDTVGRVLDLLFEAGTQKIFSALAMKAVKKYEIPTDAVHFDTTSVNVFGDYQVDQAAPPPFKIIEGYSKDHRPDLKQFLISTLCVGGDVPIFGKNEDGNRSDKQINNTILSQISAHMAQFGVKENAFIYIADSALVNPANIEHLSSSGQPFITRLPASYAECGRTVSEAVGADRWEELGCLASTKPTANRPAAFYRVAEATITLYGRSHRAIVVHSSAHDKRRQKKIERELDKEKAALEKRFNEKCLPEYACEADAKAAALAWASKISNYYDLSCQVEPTCTYAKGRPKKGQPRQVTRTGYKVNYSLSQKASAIEQMKTEAGCFVLLTGGIASEGDRAIDAKGILTLYKEQHGMEQNFSFLKDPAVVNAIFLKSEERIEALGFILLISLLIWRLIERSLRKHVKKTGRPLTGWDNKPTISPTALMVTSKFKNLTILRIGFRRRLARPLNLVQLEWLEALNLKPDIFTTVPGAG